MLSLITEDPGLVHPSYTCPGAGKIVNKVKNHRYELKEYMLINLQGECDDSKHVV